MGAENHSATTPAELPLPTVPADLRDPSSRAAYILAHFWDHMEWSDTTISLDTDFMEQNMVNFINLFQYTDTADTHTAVRTLMDAASKVPAAYTKVMDVADKYLYDPNSPMLNEEAYRLFLEHAINCNALSNDEKTRYRFNMTETDKNRRGSLGSDFVYIDTTGHSGTLHTFGNAGAMKLLLFYDPDCENCAEIITWLRNDSRVNELLSQGAVNILGIYADGDMDEWEKARTKLPASWTNGYSPDGVIAEQEIYSLRATPTIYILSPDNIVVGKDLTAPQLDAWLSNAAQ